MTSRPPTLSCSISGGGGCPGAAVTTMASKGAFGPATITVAQPDAHVVICEVSECFRGGLGQWRDNLDGADLSRQVRKDGGLIARTRTDFEHNMIGRDLGQLGHQGHDERLRYGLAEADRNRPVRISDGARSLGDEQMAFRLAHGLKDSLRQGLLSQNTGVGPG